MMKLRRELLLLRDGTAQETEIRTNKIAQLGRALEACAARRQFRGHETAVRTVAAGLLRHAAARADDECWSGADAEFYKSYARAQFGAWKQLGACGAISASRRVVVPSLLQYDSCPSDEVVGGFATVSVPHRPSRVAARRTGWVEKS